MVQSGVPIGGRSSSCFSSETNGAKLRPQASAKTWGLSVRLFVGSFLTTFAVMMVVLEASFGGTILQFVSSHLVVVVMLHAPSHAGIAQDAALG